MSLFPRISGVFFEPRSVFSRLEEKPLWVDVLIILLIAWIIYSYLVAPFSQKDALALMKDNVRLKELMGEERYNARLRQLENPSRTATLFNVLVLSPAMLLIGFFLSSLVLLIFGRFVSPHGHWRQVISCFLHANLIDKLLGNALRLVLVFLKKSVVQTSTSLVLFFPRLSFSTPAYVLLSQIDFFQLWLFGVLSYGLAAVFKISWRKALFLAYGFWLLKSVLYAGFGLLNLRFMS